MNLDEILEGKTETNEPQEAETEAKAETPEPEVEAKSEEVKAEPTGEESAPPAQDNVDEKVAAFQAKAQDEKRKRQELEARLAQLEAKPKKEAPDVLEDQQGFQSHMQQEVSQATLNAKLELSEFMARREYPDMDEKLEKYKELIAEGLVDHQKTLSSQSPWHTIAEVVEKNEKLAQLDNIDDWREQERAKIRQELEAELKTKTEEKEAKLSAIKPSLANQGSSPVSTKTWSGPTPLENMLN